MFAEAVVTFDVKYGFLTIYMQVVFIKKEVRDSVSLLLFSPIMKHSDHVAVDN